MTPLLDLDTPARLADRPVGRRWFLGSLLGAAGAVALARLPTASSAVAPTLSPGVWGSFAGPVPGSEVYLLVAVDVAGSAIAHACDGAGVAVWFRGRADDGVLNLMSTGHRLVARIRRDRIDASLTLDGVARSFALGPTPADGGLFAARAVAAGATYAASWIVLDDGRQRGLLTIGAAHQGGAAGGAAHPRHGSGARPGPVRRDHGRRRAPRSGAAGPVHPQVGPPHHRDPARPRSRRPRSRHLSPFPPIMKLRS